MKRCLSILFLLLILPLESAILSAEKDKDNVFKVETMDGIARLLVNGVAVAPRIFYGGFGVLPHEISDQGKEYTFDFVASQDSSQGIFLVTPGYETGQTQFDNITITETASGKTILPTQRFETEKDFSQNWRMLADFKSNMSAGFEKGKGCDGSGAMVISFPKASEATYKGYYVSLRHLLKLKKGLQYRLSIWMRALPANNCKFSIVNPQGIVIGAPGGDPFEQQICYAKDAGIRFIKMGVGMPWPGSGQQYNWKTVDARMQYIRDKNPDALVFVEFSVDPPTWWLDQHPDEELTYQGHHATNHRHYVRRATPSSMLFRTEMNKHVRAYVDYIEKNYGDHVAGYHFTGQNTGEWFYQGCYLGGHSGYSPSDLIAWRSWLTKRYSTTDALQQSWKTKAWSLDTVPAPPQKLWDEC
ncbi:MAG: beta-galactosidase [Planctomycetia bacterium]|nr:beta-galactosidase [Planctomycetia bacterium]